MKSKTWLFVAVAFFLISSVGWFAVAWSQPHAPDISAQDLKLSADVFPELHQVEVQAEVTDSDPANKSAPGMILMLRELGIRSSANHKIWLRAEPHPIIVKAKINVFVDEKHAADDMAQRYGAEVREKSSALKLGDDAFNLQDRLVVMRLDRVQIELSLKGAPERLLALAKAYETLVADKLGKQ